MDQRRAGQALYASRCGPEDTDVIDVIERGFRDAARRSLDCANDAVVSLEANLEAKRGRLPGANDERTRLSALLREARARGDTHSAVRLSIELNEVESLEKDVRVLKMRIGKERKRASEKSREASAEAVQTRETAESVAAFIFGAGYFEDVWEGREYLLPSGCPPVL